MEPESLGSLPAPEKSVDVVIADLDDGAILQFATQLLTGPTLSRRRFAGADGSSIELVALALADASWTELYERFAMRDRFGEVDVNSNAPWRRCLVLLRTYGAMACIIEHHYVCLDHRSEISAFYSNLDEATEFGPVRLHFFAAMLTDSALHELQSDKYLGYVVIRSEGLPPVGRAMLRPPENGTFASVVESVNLLGQKLTIEGMPFMQQDTRFATCAHASVWGIFYAAFRRGISQRHLIRDIVNSLADRSAPQPIVLDGLRPDQVQLLLQRGGMGAELHHLPAQHIGFGEVRKSALSGTDAAKFDRAYSELKALHAACAEVDKSGSLGYSLPDPATLDPAERAKHFVRESAAIVEGLSERALGVPNESARMILECRGVKAIP